MECGLLAAAAGARASKGRERGRETRGEDIDDGSRSLLFMRRGFIAARRRIERRAEIYAGTIFSLLPPHYHHYLLLFLPLSGCTRRSVEIYRVLSRNRGYQGGEGSSVAAPSPVKTPPPSSFLLLGLVRVWPSLLPRCTASASRGSQQNLGLQRRAPLETFSISPLCCVSFCVGASETVNI